MKRIVLAASALTLVSGCVAVDNSTYMSDSQGAAVQSSDLVTARQAQMRTAAITLGSVSRVGADETADPSKASFAAGGLAKFGRVLPIYFDDETRLETDNGALAQVWDDPDGFASAAANFEEATSQLAMAAAENNRPAFTEALASTKAACKACHDAYRAD